MSKVVVLGLGYIGLPTAATLALHGWDVLGVDVRPEIVEALRDGNVPVRERDLSAIVRDAIGNGQLKVSVRAEAGDYFILCVPTPVDGQRADLTYVRKAAHDISSYLGKGSTVLVESTVPPGTTGNVVRPILERKGLRAGKDFRLAYCPERVMPGNILRELVENNRIVGGFDRRSAEAAEALYRSFVRGQIYLTDLVTAEFVKLVENAYRDVNIAFANEISTLAEAHGVNIWEAIALANRHPRVNILEPGPGVGGHCIAVDPWFLYSPGVDWRIIPAARELNDRRPEEVAKMTLSILKGIPHPKVAVFGVAYKGNADDVRESPAIRVIESLAKRGVTVVPYDPHVPNERYPTNTLEEALTSADCMLILANHREFQYMDPSMLSQPMRHKYLLDTKNSVDHGKWVRSGFTVHVMGNPRTAYVAE